MMKTELIFILDRSGSMHGLEQDTIGGFNGLIEKQKTESGEAIVSLLLFDDQQDLIIDKQSLENIKPLTDREYYVRGCTALLDAIGGTVTRISRLQNETDESDRPDKTMVVIITDGLENASREFSYDKVKSLIEKKKKDNWEFMFLGANIDAIGEAGRFGIDEDYAVEYRCDSEGTALNYCCVSEAISDIRANRKLAASWKGKIENDLKSRK